MKPTKPLGRTAYGSIPHLPGSRRGPADHGVNEGQARICTERTRDSRDVVIVQEKLDGSCTAVAMVDGEIVALGRAGYPARTSPYEHHVLFADWVQVNEARFRRVLREGERLCGEWLAQAHGTVYALHGYEPWAVFDLMVGNERATYADLCIAIGHEFMRPRLLSQGPPVSVQDALEELEAKHWPCDEVEGVVYRVERDGKVDFLAKYVRHEKQDGKYLPEISGKPAVWNWRPDQKGGEV